MRFVNLFVVFVFLFTPQEVFAQAKQAAKAAKRPTAAKKKPISNSNVPLRAQREVIRRGDMVEVVGEGFEAAQIETDIALAVPDDDSWKWYISIITQDDCPVCDYLKQDFLTDPNLQAWVSVDDPEKSWAHYKVYRWEDKTVHRRFENIKISGFPTILIQPPRNQHFGPSSTIVFQKTGYGSKRGSYKDAGKKLSDEMSSTVKRYVKAFQDPDKQKHWRKLEREEGRRPDYQVEDGNFKALINDDSAENRILESKIEGIGQPPFEFDGIPSRDPKYPVTPPKTIIPPDESATADELRKAIPDADSEFILKQLEEGATVEQAVASWKRIRPLQPLLDGWRPFHYIRIIFEILLGTICFLLFVILVLVVGFSVYNKNKTTNVVAATSPAPTSTVSSSTSTNIPG